MSSSFVSSFLATVHAHDQCRDSDVLATPQRVRRLDVARVCRNAQRVRLPGRLKVGFSGQLLSVSSAMPGAMEVGVDPDVSDNVDTFPSFSRRQLVFCLALCTCTAHDLESIIIPPSGGPRPSLGENITMYFHIHPWRIHTKCPTW